MTKLFYSLFLFLFVTQFAAAGDRTLVVTTAWLADNLQAPGVVILHVGSKDSYEAQHVPGSHHAEISSFVLREGPSGISHEFPSLASLESSFQSYGITANSQIILIPAEDHALPRAARLFITLDYVGLGNQAAILDGGLPVWIAEGRPTTKNPPQSTHSSLDLIKKDNLAVDQLWLSTHLRDDGLAIVDGRPADYYSGAYKSDHVVAHGHIAGAVSLPFLDFTEQSAPLKFKSPSEITQLFTNSGIKPTDVIVTYCDSGIWGAVPYFAARSVGYDVRFYDGSFQEWTRDRSNPVIGPVQKNNLLSKLKTWFD